MNLGAAFLNVPASSDDGGLGNLATAGPAEHPWLWHESYIRADMARLSAVQALQDGVSRRPPVLTPQTPASPALVERIQAALLTSKHTRRDVKKALLDQGFGTAE